MGTSLFALLDLGAETLLRPRYHSIQVVPCLSQQFVKHAPGAFMEVSESLCLVRRGFRDSGSSQQVQQWHLSLAFSKFVEGDLLHQAAPWLVAQDLPHALVVTASNGLSLDQAREHVVNTQLGLGRSVLEKL